MRAFRTRWGILCALGAGFLTGCPTDNGLNEIPPDQSDGPMIEVPSSVLFDAIANGQTNTQIVTVRNVGKSTLQVSSILVESSAAFSVSFLEAQYLEEDQTFDVVVTYTGLNIEDHGILVVNSNDPAKPAAHVELIGSALLPVLQIDPSPLEFDSVAVCQSDKESLTLTNVGTAELVIDSLTATGDGFVLVPDFELPIVLDPKASAWVDVRFTPHSTAEYAGEIWATTNEATGATSAQLSGEGGGESLTETIDTFRQPDGPWEQTDVMFYVDHSLSMKNNLVNLADNFGRFLAAVAELDADYQIMVATGDNGCHNEDIITPATPSPETMFFNAIHGPDGDYTEAGLFIANNALAESGLGGCNEGFLRDGAKTVVVLVSDEPDQSPDPEPKNLIDPWLEMVQGIQASAPGVSIVAIAGDVPLGCDNLADPGHGYYEASLASGGDFLSICTDDWGDHLEVIADIAAGAPTGTFELAYVPDPATIVVEVNGVVVSNWTYDEMANTIVFPKGSWPDPGAWIEVAYELPGECIEKE